jgi:hypothetical protein
VSCQACPDNANCRNPNPAACLEGQNCTADGFLLPQDGYWHSNFFSEQVCFAKALAVLAVTQGEALGSYVLRAKCRQAQG